MGKLTFAQHFMNTLCETISLADDLNPAGTASTPAAHPRIALRTLVAVTCQIRPEDERFCECEGEPQHGTCRVVAAAIVVAVEHMRAFGVELPVHPSNPLPETCEGSEFRFWSCRL